MPSNHLILCCPLLRPSILPSNRIFSNESALRIRWPKHRSFSFSISPSNEYSGLISFRKGVTGQPGFDWLLSLTIPMYCISLPRWLNFTLFFFFFLLFQSHLLFCFYLYKICIIHFFLISFSNFDLHTKATSIQINSVYRQVQIDRYIDRYIQIGVYRQVYMQVFLQIEKQRFFCSNNFSKSDIKIHLLKIFIGT